MSLEAFNPVSPNAFIEGFFLAPEDVFWEVGVLRNVKGFPQDILLNLLMRAIRHNIHFNLQDMSVQIVKGAKIANCE